MIKRNKIFFIAFILIFNVSVNSFATEMQVRPGVKGIWFQPNETESSDFVWNAQWIWLDESLNSDVMLTRRTFDLSGIPQSAVLRITASSKYQLYVNGEYICRGPARCTPHHQSYDILEISGLLHKGKNSIAVRVHHQKEKFSYHYKGRAGLLAQLDYSLNEKETSILVSDSNWKVSTDPSWDNRAPKISRFQQIVNDRVDFQNYLSGWNELDFDDSSWSNAIPLMRNVGWLAPQKNAIPQPLTPPWTSLVPRDIPYLIETNVQAVKLIEAIQIEEKSLESPLLLSGIVDEKIIKKLSGFQRRENPIEIPVYGSEKNWFLLFDLGTIRIGMPKLEIQGSPGTEVNIVCAPFLIDEKFNYKMLDSEYLDKIILSGDKDFWEATYFKPARYLGIVVKKETGPVSLFSAGIHQIKYPFERKGFIKSADAPWVKRYMDAAAKTIQVCTTDAFTDNYRERRQYAQTGYYAALGNYFTFGDVALQRRYLIQVALEQEANGMMPAYAPAASDDFMVIMDSNCLWIRSLRNYLLFSGDYKTVKELLPSAKKLLELLHIYTDSLGLIDNPPYPYWLDHALNDRRGANFNLNGHYLGALEDFAQVLDWLNEHGSDNFQSRANLLRQSLQTHLWDEQKQLFADALIDGKRSKMFSEHANAMALAMNVATPEQAKMIAKQLLVQDKHNYIKRESGLVMVTPAMSYFLHKGLCQYGFIDESLEMFRNRFDKMLGPNTNGTLWEEWRLDGIGRTGNLQMGRTRSDAQTESAFPPALFTEFLLGVNPTKPGMKEVEIKRTSSTLKNIESEIPTPEGILKVKWSLNKNGSELILDIPGEMKVKLNLESLGFYKGNEIKLNGKELNSNFQSEQFLKLSKGKQNIEF